MTIMPSGKEPEPGKFARAFSAQVRSSMARQRVSGSQLAVMIGRSQSYVSKRLRDEASFTANDAESICTSLHEDLLEVMIRTIRSMR